MVSKLLQLINRVSLFGRWHWDWDARTTVICMIVINVVLAILIAAGLIVIALQINDK